MRIFLAGIMQGSLTALELHAQDYRQHLKQLLAEHLPHAEVYDPLAEHFESLAYDHDRGREVFFGHNRLCREVDVVLAFVPEASMGTAIEMWEAHQTGKMVVAISPLEHNWAVKYLSHLLFANLAEFESALVTGKLAAQLVEFLSDDRRSLRSD